MKRLLMTIVILTLGTSSVFAQDVKREITRVTDDVYRFQNKYHVNMFVITGDGVVITDPINLETAGYPVEKSK